MTAPLIKVPGEPYKPQPQQAAYERAARLLCTKRDVDPDEVVKMPVQGMVGVQIVDVPAWCFAADELVTFSECLTALQEAYKGAGTAS